MVRAVVVAAAALLVLGNVAVADPLGDVRTGTQAFRESRLDDAVLAFTRAIDSNGLSQDELALTLNNRGVAYNEVGDFARAIADYDRSLTLKPDDVTTLKNLRIAYTRRALKAIADGTPQPALADLGKAIELDPAHPAAYQRRAALQRQQGRDDLALADLERAAQLAPNDAEIRQELRDVRTATQAARDKASATAMPPRQAAPEPSRPAAQTAPVPAPPPLATIEPSAPPVQPVAPAPPRPDSTAAGIVDGQRLVLMSDVFVRARAESAAPPIGTLRKGAEVTRLAFDKGWAQVEMDDGRRGWFYQRFAEPASP